MRPSGDTLGHHRRERVILLLEGSIASLAVGLGDALVSTW